jgi:hypothetical protein
MVNGATNLTLPWKRLDGLIQIKGFFGKKIETTVKGLEK